MELEEKDVILCTVDRILGATVFVKLPDGSEGSITMSEVAPGRIRNLREYVVPNKRIVCKVLRKSGTHIDLSLRRVTPKERKEALDAIRQERRATGMFASVLGKEKANALIEKIRKDEHFVDFLEDVKQNPSILEKLVDKASAKRLFKLITAEKIKKVTLKKTYTLTTTKPDGVTIIKKLLTGHEPITITYLAPGTYTLSLESTDLKKADQHLQETANAIEKNVKKAGAIFAQIKTK